MAARLAALGVVCDVFDQGELEPDVGRLALLPEPGRAREAFDLDTTVGYDAVLQTGPWQSPIWMRRLLRARGPVPWIYLPRGGLGRVEFSRPRDVKKFPYLALIERRFIAAADAVIFSSETERRHTLAWSYAASQAVIVPDFVAPADREAVDPGPAAVVTTFAFLAEISPRKGLHLLVDAFIGWVRSNGLKGRVRLVVGGAPRPGSEAYLEAIRARQRAAEDEVEIVFLGAVPHGDRDAFYAAADVLVVASSFESFGLTVFEAASAGCIVLCTPDVGALEQTRGLTGVIAMPAATVEVMAQGLGDALEAVQVLSRPRRAAAAEQAIEVSNTLALVRWSGILGLERLAAPTLQSSSHSRRPE